jgi:hypothetical protein
VEAVERAILAIKPIAAKSIFMPAIKIPKHVNAQTLKHIFNALCLIIVVLYLRQVLKTIFPDLQWQDGFFDGQFHFF